MFGWFFRRRMQKSSASMENTFPLGIGIRFGSGDSNGERAISIDLVAQAKDQWLRKNRFRLLKSDEVPAMVLADLLEEVALECRRFHRAHEAEKKNERRDVSAASPDKEREPDDERSGAEEGRGLWLAPLEEPAS